MGADPLAAPGIPHPLRRGGLDIDLVPLHTQEITQAGTHCIDVGPHSGRLGNDGGIQVTHDITA